MAADPEERVTSAAAATDIAQTGVMILVGHAKNVDMAYTVRIEEDQKAA